MVGGMRAPGLRAGSALFCRAAVAAGCRETASPRTAARPVTPAQPVTSATQVLPLAPSNGRAGYKSPDTLVHDGARRGTTPGTNRINAPRMARPPANAVSRGRRQRLRCHCGNGSAPVAARAEHRCRSVSPRLGSGAPRWHPRMPSSAVPWTAERAAGPARSGKRDHGRERECSRASTPAERPN